jgi:hypothetical protein
VDNNTAAPLKSTLKPFILKQHNDMSTPLVTEKICEICGVKKGQDSYSGTQWKYKSGRCQCIGCLQPKQAGVIVHEKDCKKCGQTKSKPYYAKRQFEKNGNCLSCQGFGPPSLLTKSCATCGETKEANHFGIASWYAETGSCIGCSKTRNKNGRSAADAAAAATKVTLSINKVRKAEATNDHNAAKKARAELKQAQLGTQRGRGNAQKKARRDNENRICDAEKKKVAAANLALVAAKQMEDESVIESAKAKLAAATESYDAVYNNTEYGKRKTQRVNINQICNVEKKKVAAAELALVAAKQTKDQSEIESANAKLAAATESYNTAYSKTSAGYSKAKRDLLVFGDGFSIKKSVLFDTNHRETQTLYNPSKHSKGDNVMRIGNILSNHKNLTKEELVMQIKALELES